MFFLVEASGPLNGRNQLKQGFTSFSRPEHMPMHDIYQWLLEHDIHEGDNNAPNLVKAECPDVQPLESWNSFGCMHYSLLVKAKGYQQAEDKARKYGLDITPAYISEQQRSRNFKDRVKKFENEVRDLFGPKTQFKKGKFTNDDKPRRTYARAY